MQLVRRFFLADTDLATAVGAAPAALQYVQSAQLVVTSQMAWGHCCFWANMCMVLEYWKAAAMHVAAACCYGP